MRRRREVRQCGLCNSLVSTNPDVFKPVYRTPDPDIDDGFMKKRITEAWRLLRLARKDLEAEIHRYEVETRRKYQGGRGV